MDSSSDLAQRLWRVSRCLNNCSPFSQEILSLNRAEMDFILEMYSKDNPEKLKFRRNVGAEQSVALVAWANFLTGKDKIRLLARHAVNPATLQQLKNRR